MIELIAAILFAVLMATVIYYLLKKAVFLLINAIVGLLALFLINLFGVMSWFGAPDIPITAATVIVCAFGGLPGALLLVALALAGITI
jgi:inhibitor of the pro-sigma K processing machinery